MFNTSAFLSYLNSTFYGFENSFIRETIQNLISYGLINNNTSKDQFCYFLSDILSEVTFGEVAMFMDDSLLTQWGQEEKARIKEGQ